MARQKGNVGLGKNGKRGRPRKVVAVADGNGVERNTEALQKAAKTIIKVKGKRGRPVGSTKKGKKRGRPPKAANKNAKNDNEHKHDLSDNNVENRADMETHQHNVDEREVGDDEDDNERSAESD
ncbi:unnamed protein product [Anisakis simplex]|uniref:AT hook-like n=1 Tax=Anisakis simplex TaxID=6269 RepID=A0A0M3JTJ4_ANISI|nr:unnamed protein product [Anisakis simplex]